MKSGGSTFVPTWQGEGQSEQQPREPGRDHLRRSRRVELAITGHTGGCYVLPAMHEVGRIFFKQEKRITLICPLNMDCWSPK